MEKQSPPPAPACKQSGDTVDACPSCGLFPDDPSFCLWLNHRKIHQALAIPGAPCAQGASEQESARIFAEVTWKVACGGNFTCRNLPRPCSLVPLCEGKWRDHPYILHRLRHRHAAMLSTSTSLLEVSHLVSASLLRLGEGLYYLLIAW